MSYINGKEILISGGTGSLGEKLTILLLKKYKPKGIRIFSRGELLQWEMKNKIKQRFSNAPIAFLIGDIRDRKRIELATRGVDIIIHCAALKQIPVGEDNPLEVIQTNIIGAQNILYAALENKVEKVMAISTDKACYPTNLYGATKLAAEKLFINGHIYGGNSPPKFSCCRYGNVLGSRGSIVPLFRKQAKEAGMITITHKDMTRFWITLENAAKFILRNLADMQGGEIFVPMMPSARVQEIAQAVTGDAPVKYIGIRPGEKLHEILITKEESRKTFEDLVNNQFVIFGLSDNTIYPEFEYRSETNHDWLTVEKIQEMINGNV
jgi:FlaA1/EpsC-like NDP-sugar epimerase